MPGSRIFHARFCAAPSDSAPPSHALGKMVLAVVVRVQESRAAVVSWIGGVVWGFWYTGIEEWVLVDCGGRSVGIGSVIGVFWVSLGIPI